MRRTVSASSGGGSYDHPRAFTPPSAATSPRIRERADALSDDEREVVQLAFTLVQNLPDSDPRSMYRMSALHCFYASGQYVMTNGVQMGDPLRTWLFLPYHRGLLLFMERTMQKLLVDHINAMPASTKKRKLAVLAQNFALPYWDWTQKSGSGSPPVPVPSMYWTPGASTALPNPTNHPLAREISGNVANQLNFTYQANLGITSPDRLFGTATSPGAAAGTCEEAPHHNAGGWMDHLFHSAREPIFYAHHANLDRMWSAWAAVVTHDANPMPASSVFKATRFRFPDADGQWVDISAATLSTATTGDLGYNYDRLKAAQ